MLADLERTGESQIALTDPDSRAMAAQTKVAVGYNIQVAVDAKNKMIVEQAVTNQVVDLGLLTQTAEPARAILDVETIDVVADRGYFKIEDGSEAEWSRRMAGRKAWNDKAPLMAQIAYRLGRSLWRDCR
jgi:Transposase DDE domain